MLVEDNPGDVKLLEIAFEETKFLHNLTVASDGIEAMQLANSELKYSNNHRQNLIILDLNLPKKSGWEVLKEIKHNNTLKTIPIIILTSSSEEKDIEESYKNHVNAYLIKPVNLDQFIKVAKSIQDFWLKNVRLP